METNGVLSASRLRAGDISLSSISLRLTTHLTGQQRLDLGQLYVLQLVHLPDSRNLCTFWETKKKKKEEEGNWAENWKWDIQESRAAYSKSAAQLNNSV